MRIRRKPRTHVARYGSTGLLQARLARKLGLSRYQLSQILAEKRPRGAWKGHSDVHIDCVPNLYRDCVGAGVQGAWAEQPGTSQRGIPEYQTACGCGYPFGGGTAEGSKRGQALMPSGACFFRAWSRFALRPSRRMRPCEKPCQT